VSHRAKPKRKTLCVVLPIYRGVSTEWFENWLAMDQTPIVNDAIKVNGGTMVTQAMDDLIKDALALDQSWERLVVM
jgi:hypothetical protein